MTIQTAAQIADQTTRAAHAEMCRIQDRHGPSSPEAIATEARYDAAAEARAAIEAIAHGEVR